MHSFDGETIFAMENSSIKFGKGATEEVGYECDRLGINNVLIITDKTVAELPVFERVLKSLDKKNVHFTVYKNVKIEPTDASFKDASETALSGLFDGFIAVGGGSAIDTAKAANLYSTFPAEFFDYVNAPIGKGKGLYKEFNF